MLDDEAAGRLSAPVEGVTVRAKPESIVGNTATEWLGLYRGGAREKNRAQQVTRYGVAYQGRGFANSAAKLLQAANRIWYFPLQYVNHYYLYFPVRGPRRILNK